MANTDDIYQKVILEHNRNPRFNSVPEGYTHHGVSSNPLCGDHIEIFLKITDDNLTEVGFEGVGCAVCKSSASLLLSSIHGLEVSKAKQFIGNLDSILEKDPEDLESFGDLQAFSVMRKFPTRFKCVKLSWSAASSAIDS